MYNHIKAQVERLCKVDGLKGVHLDYVRYSDVILAKALQPVYNLVQDKEYPEFDFCYCETCREKFKAKSGLNVMELEDPSANAEWRQYRYDSVTKLVNRLVDVVHSHSKLITAAVFPYPELARIICRQSWDQWNLDAVFPMVYQNFYDEDINWIGSSVEKGVNGIDNRMPLFAGLYLPELSPSELKQAMVVSHLNGAAGVAVFDYGGCKPGHFTTISTYKNE